jgi:hypothetical protein
LHIAALMAEYLKLRKIHPWGAEAFDQISINISKDERNLKLDAGEICMSALLYRPFIVYYIILIIVLFRLYRIVSKIMKHSKLICFHS